MRGCNNKPKYTTMTYKIKRILIILVFLSFSAVSFAEDPPPPEPPPCPGQYDPPVGSPIEDGIPIVIGLALVYGALKLHQTRKKMKETGEKV